MANSENINVGKAYVTIVPSLEGAQKTISTELGAATEGASDEVGKKSGSTFGESFAKGIKTVALTIGAAVVAVTGAAVKGVIELTTQAVNEYAEFEQLQGGVQKLFGESADMVAQYANEAYKTAGLSANDYMETVTGFSASLISSLQGDTAKAAEIADQAIRDMSDNANTFGTDIESIQNAYQGFAKGQFNMLDNLKLGYGGTKTEMERLLADAQAISGVEYDIDNYADVVQAISVIQEEMGIAGATAKEASGTIQGSLGSLKGAWSNLLAGLGNKTADLKPLIDNVVSSALDVVNNIKPIATQAITGISELITGLAPVVAEQLPPMIESLLPALSAAVLSLVSALSATIPTLMNIVSGLITQLLPVLMAMLPVICNSLFQLITTLVGWLSEPANVQMLVSGIVQLATTIVKQFGLILPILLPAVVQIVSAVALELTKLENVGLILESVLLLVGAVLMALAGTIPEFIEYVAGILQNIESNITAFLNWISPALAKNFTDNLSNLKNFGTNIKNFIIGLIDGIKTNFTTWLTYLKTSFSGAFENIKNKISSIISNITGFVGTAISTLQGLPDAAVDMGKNLIKGLWDGITDKVDWVVEKIKGMGSKIISAIKDVFGIASPSKVFAEVGDYLAQGLGLGFEDGMGGVESDMISQMNGLTESMTAEVTAYAPQGGLTGGDVVTYNGGNISINVYGAEGQDVNSLADIIAEKLEDMTARKGAVYA